MAKLIIDTETTGFPKKYGALIQDGQARVCQVAMLLTDDDGKSLAEFSCLIKPDRWEIHENAAKVHGFTNELCEQYGISAKSAYAFFTRMAKIADMIVAHNSEFDMKMMQIEAAYCEQDFPETPWYCTMIESSPILNLPPTEKMMACGFTKNKPPNLGEALKFMCDKELGSGAHNAMYDVAACRDIYFAVEKHKNGQASNRPNP